MQPTLKGPLRLAGAYVLFSSAWILGSDSLLKNLTSDAEQMASLQTVKGLVFILLSSLLIFIIAYRDRLTQQQLLNQLLRKSRQMQQSLRNAALAHWEYNDNFYWSDEALALLQQPPERNPSDLEQLLSWLHPGERPAVQRAMQALIFKHEPLSISARLNQPQQAPTLWLMLRAEVDEQGKILGTVQDISGQKRDESALRESEQRFRQLFEQTPRIAVQGYDRERRVIYWNQASTQLYGYSLQEVMGKRLEELIVPPAERRKVADAINRWQLGGPPIPAAEIELQRKDGSPVWVFSSHLMLRNSREQLELYCVDIDLSQQKRVDSQLHLSETRYRELVEHLSDAIFMTDDQQRLVFLNPAWSRITGYPAHASLGQPLQRFIPEIVQPPLHLYLQELSQGKRESLRHEAYLHNPQGQLRRVELQLQHSETGQGLRGSLRDIHERYQTQQLQQARNAVLDKLLGQYPLEQILEAISLRLEALNPHMLVSIMLLDEQQNMHVGAAPSLPMDYRQAVEGIRADLQVGSCGHALSTGELVIAEDIDQHPYWQDYLELTRAAGLQACWSLPFKDDRGQVLGTFGIYGRQPGRPAPADIALVTEFTRLAGLAVRMQRSRPTADHQSPT